MKIKIDSFEVDIKAKGVYNKERNNKEDLQHFLNLLSIVFEESAKYNERVFNTPCDYRQRVSDALYNELNNDGFYDRAKK